MGTPTKAKSTKNTKIQLGDGGAPESFTTVGEVTSFSGPSAEQNEIDVTNFDSAGREYIGDGLADGGQVTFDMNFVGSDAQQQALRAAVESGVTKNMKVILNDNLSTPTTFSFAAVIKKFDGPKGGIGEAYKASITTRVSGAVTKVYAP